jgi:hypothetical protein
LVKEVLMERSAGVLDALLTFYARITAGEVEKFDLTVSNNPATMMCGTAPGEIVRERDRLRFGFETEGVSLVAGVSPEAYEEGRLGWAFDEPLFGFPDGTVARVRVTIVFLKEDVGWMFVHGHVSAGVPDEEVVELQKRWNVV